MKSIISFLKKETVLCVALVLAAVSAFIVPPDAEYIEYIDFRTLAVLFCLMSVMAGLQQIGVFKNIAGSLLAKVKSSNSLVLLLILLCFFFSMFITNDVALITFVPFTFTILDMLGEDKRKDLVLPVVVLQTIAANLGSMLTPIGNPQNLYLYGKAGISIGSFIILMLPYTVFSLLILAVSGLLIGTKNSKKFPYSGTKQPQFNQISGNLPSKPGYKLYIYLFLFISCLLAVGHIIAWQEVLAAVLVTIIITDRQVLAKVDYSLLFTFAGFFVFIGNVGRISAFRDFLQGIIINREVYTSIIASQFISNVPAALLLSGFTANYRELIIGTNLGGLGTLIASMASLISYKYIAKEESSRKIAYIGLFTAANIGFLAALILLYNLTCIF